MQSKSLTKEELQKDYLNHKPSAEAFLREFLHQLEALIRDKDINLGVQLEGRVKAWSSLAEKVDRKELQLTGCQDLSDLIGTRAITLFRRDEDTLCKLIEKTFSIKSKEDKGAALASSSFGYASRHFQVKIPKAWKKVPAFAGLDYTVEIQVRTLSQHIWAASSHILQYKKETDVPPTVVRSIYRAAALLETVDLEFERVLQERDRYSKSRESRSINMTLDADNLRALLDRLLPPANRKENEPYSQLLTDLAHMNISTVGQLESVITSRLSRALEVDKEIVQKRKTGKDLFGTTNERLELGVFFTHVGLVRRMLELELGDKWLQYRSQHLTKATQAGEHKPKN